MLNEINNGVLEIPGSPQKRKEFIEKDLFKHNPTVNQALNAHYRGDMSWQETMEYLVCCLANENQKQQREILRLEK